MIYSLRGNVALINNRCIIVETNNIGYQVFVSDPSCFKTNETVLLYIYEVIREDDHFLVGFKSLEEKQVFNALLLVKGIGPKSAIGILKYANPSQIKEAISCSNIAYLKKIPGIGSKGAYQILLDLKGKYEEFNTCNPNQYDDVKAALKELGYKATQIDRVLSQINEPDKTVEEIIKIALSKLKSKE